MDWIAHIFDKLGDAFVVKFLLSPAYVAATVLIVFALWLVRGKPTGFLRYLFPRELYVHPSTMVDLKIAFFNTVITATGAITALFMIPFITVTVLDQLIAWSGEPPEQTTTWAGSALAAVVLLLTQDFCRYWNHYLHHGTRLLWPFHAVHHSAEVLTPVTFLRAHPVYSALLALIMSVLVGAAQALVLFLLVGQVQVWVVYVSTLAFNAHILFGGHLRHSHIWLSYGRVLEHVLISPAQHQIHHSCDPKHFDKNFGEIFAIWDWMFGTLYIPDGQETLTFGVADQNGVRLEQPHPTLRAAVFGPFAEAWEEIWKGTSRDPALRAPAPDEAP
ncbi:sterol desaturase family protein [Rhodobacteraceae bacterium NNCM2]|nr:sterol desaturase family protein [Coraliihabitans acroporae]